MEILSVNGIMADFRSETLRTRTGHSVGLRPQAFAVLRHLAEHAGQLITKDEFMQAVWPQTAVTDDSLVQCIHEIRRALRDHRRELVVTAPRRGYRLVLPAERDSSATKKHLCRGSNRVVEISPNGASSQGLEDRTVRTRLSIAVLPFVNMSTDTEQNFLSDSLAEDIITDLSRWTSMRVVSQHATSRFKVRHADMQAVARELDVDFLVEGSVRRMGDEIRITVQLVDPATGIQIWAERFDHEIANMLAVHDEVVRTIVGTLVGRVYMSAAEHLRRKSTSNLAAYDLTMRANWLPWDIPASNAEAKRCFEQAIALDPEYGLPHSLLALMLRWDWHNDFSGSREILDRAFDLARRGVELADNDSIAHMAIALVHLDLRSFDLALNHMQRAVEINPANPWHQADFGCLLCHIGRAEEALDRLLNARQTDPFLGPPWYWQALGLTQFVLHRYSEALGDFDRATAKSHHNLAIMAGCCAKLGLPDRAEELVAQCLSALPEATIDGIVAKIVFKNAQDSEHLAECLRLAGMPE